MTRIPSGCGSEDGFAAAAQSFRFTGHIPPMPLAAFCTLCLVEVLGNRPGCCPNAGTAFERRYAFLRFARWVTREDRTRSI